MSGKSPDTLGFQAQKNIYFSSSAKLSDMIGDFLKKHKQQVLILVSTDFCHDLSRQETDMSDRTNMEIITQLKKGFPLGLTCDSVNSWHLVLNVIHDPDKRTELVFHMDNEKYTGIVQESITSYFFSIIYTLK